MGSRPRGNPFTWHGSISEFIRAFSTDGTIRVRENSPMPNRVWGTFKLPLVPLIAEILGDIRIP